jgi:hypothetical protein
VIQNELSAAELFHWRRNEGVIVKIRKKFYPTVLTAALIISLLAGSDAPAAAATVMT